MRLGLVTDLYYPWIGGPSILVRTLAQGLSARGHAVSILAPSPDGPARLEVENAVPVTRVRTLPSPFGHNLRFAVAPGRAVDRWLTDFCPDIVNVHHPFPLSATAILRAGRHGVPVAATNHTIPECTLWGIRGVAPLYRPAYAAFGLWLRWLLARCDTVATPTATAVDALRSLGFRGAIATISNGVDCRRFSPDAPDGELRADLGLDSRPVVLYTGRLDADKDMGTWLRAAAQLRRSVDVQLVIGGNGTDRAALEGLARELGIAHHTRFIGYVPDTQFPDLYRLADVYFIASPVELQSITTLEAMASGLPIVAARAAALPELVADGENGYLFESGVPEDGMRGLAMVLQDEEGRRLMGQRSRERALAHDLEQSIAAYECFLESTSRMSRGRAGERATAGGR